MANSQMSEVIQHLRRTMLLRDGAALTDGQLLEAFISRRDQEALAALVWRHGPMVWGVCRRILHNHEDAEDAFQAAFLVLVRKAKSILPREMVANWLYGVARQTALNVRATAAKRKTRESQVTEMPEPVLAEQDHWADLQSLLDAELGRLPDRYRAVIVLCDLEGKTRKEAARQIGVPEGTVAGRLARARAMLAKRLARHGLMVSSGALASVIAQEATAGVPSAVLESTIKAASLFAAGTTMGVVSTKVAALTEGMVKAMFVTKLKSVLTVVLVVGLALAGTAGLLYQTHAADQPEAKGEGRPDQTQPAEQSKGRGSPVANIDQQDEKGRPMPKEEPAPGNAKTEQKFLTPDEAIKQMPKENVTIQFKVAKVEAMPNPGTGFGGPTYYIYLHDGGKFTARLAKAADQFMKLGVDPVQHFTGKVVRVTGKVEPYSGSSIQMWLRDLADIELVKDQPKGMGGPPIAKKHQQDEKGRPMTKAEAALGNAKTEQKVLKVLAPEEAIKQRSKEAVTVKFKIAAVQDMSRMPTGGFGQGFILLKDGGSFSVRLVPPAINTLMQLGIEPTKHFVGKFVLVTGLVQPDPAGAAFHILVSDFNQPVFTVVAE